MKSTELIEIEAFEQDTGLYYVELPNGIYEVNSERIEISYSNNKVIVELGKDLNIFKINKYTIVDNYIYENESITKEAYDAKVTELRLKGYDDDLESWYDIDSEYEYKKFTQKWKPEYISTEVKQPVNFNIKHSISSLPKYIEPMRKLNGDLKSTIYVYNQRKHIADIVREFLLNIGYTEAKSEYTSENEFYITPDGIRFSKFGKSRDFITIKMNLQKYEDKGIYKDAYQNVFDLYNKNIKEITEILTIWYLKDTKIEISTYLELISKLEKFKNDVNALGVLSKFSPNKHQLYINIDKYIKKLKSELLQNEKYI